jgi:hypothetical protein
LHAHTRTQAIASPRPIAHAADGETRVRMIRLARHFFSVHQMNSRVFRGVKIASPQYPAIVLPSQYFV